MFNLILILSINSSYFIMKYSLDYILLKIKSFVVNFVDRHWNLKYVHIICLALSYRVSGFLAIFLLIISINSCERIQKSITLNCTDIKLNCVKIYYITEVSLFSHFPCNKLLLRKSYTNNRCVSYFDGELYGTTIISCFIEENIMIIMFL